MRRRIALMAGIVLLLAAGQFMYPRLRALWHHHRLVERLAGEDATQRLRAAVDLAAFRDARAVPVLLAALERDDGAGPGWDKQIAALCHIGGTAAIGALEAALQHPGTGRSLVIEALACIDDPAARVALAKLLETQDETLLQTAVMTLSGSSDPRILALLTDAEERANRARKLVILTSLTDSAGRPLAPRLADILTAAANGPDEVMRGVARRSLRWEALDRPGSAGIWAEDGATSAPGDTVDQDLAPAARRATAFLAARQDPAGYWRISRTHQPRYERIFAEVNTWLTPVMVDMLDPIAAETGLGGNLARARKQIAGEIETGGLVRYYGSAAGAFGAYRICAISFDADDTALAWRIAPVSDPHMLREALTTLRRYRAPNGLYRTWLAETDRQQCIDRGNDPNPTDVGIQMHILMLLSRASPAEAQALCGALRKAIADDRTWVYYQREPLIPMLRQVDLTRAGCPLEIPETRIRADLAGQGKWLAVGRALLRLSYAEASAGDKAATIRLLQGLARGDFVAIRKAPPLLYQNDATGRVPAFYWSQEFGYALWLRLYFETLRGNAPPPRTNP